MDQPERCAYTIEMFTIMSHDLDIDRCSKLFGLFKYSTSCKENQLIYKIYMDHAKHSGCHQLHEKLGDIIKNHL